MRSMVEGVCADLCEDGDDGSFYVVQHDAGWNTQGADVAGGKVAVANGFVIQAAIVRAAVNLDGERGPKAEEISDVWPEWVLAAEFMAVRATTKLLPQ